MIAAVHAGFYWLDVIKIQMKYIVIEILDKNTKEIL